MQDIKTNTKFTEKDYTKITDEEILEYYKDSSDIFNALKEYLEGLPKKVLSKDDFDILFTKYKNGDATAGQKIIDAHLHLVPYIIKENCIINSKEDFENLIKKGNEILALALDKYDESFNTSFISFAYNWIHSKISTNTRLPIELRTLYYKFINTINKYYESYGTYPEDDYLIKTLEIDTETLKSLYDIKNTLTINTTIDNLQINKKVILLYLKKLLTPYEYYILYHVWYNDLSKTNNPYLINNLESILEIYNNILFKYSYEMTTEEGYKKVLKKIKQKNILESDITPSDFEFLKEDLYNLNHDDILSILDEEYYNMTPQEQELIENFFNPDIAHIYPIHIERALKIPNLSYSGYYSKDIQKHVPLEELYKTYLEHKEDFTEEVQGNLESIFFAPITKCKKRRKRNHDLTYQIQRLEVFYYNIDRPFELLIPKDELLAIINDPANNFKEKAKELLKLKFVDGISTKEIAEQTNANRDKTRDYIWDAYEVAVNIALNRTTRVKIPDEDRYYEYIMDDRYFFTDNSREMCRLFFIEHKDYKYINSIFNIGTIKISNIITEAIRKMDFYYYGINYDEVIPKYPEEAIQEVLENNNYSSTEKDLIVKRYIKLIPLLTLSKEYNIEYNEIRKLMDDFNSNYKEFYKDYTPTLEEIIYEYNKPTIESALSDYEKSYLSLSLGIESSINPTGKKASKEEIMTTLNINENQFFHTKYRINRKVMEAKLGFNKIMFDLFTRKELITILDDPHLPLSEFEIAAIKEVKGIDTEPLNYKDVAKKYNMNGSSVLRRINRAYVTIKKYQLNEIDPKISYEIDIVPYLRYFPKFEQKVLYERYQLNWTLSDFIKNYNLTNDMALRLINRTEKKLLYMMKYKDAKKFDFDYARSVLHNDDLPFYSNQELIAEIYTRYFGDNGNPPENVNDIINNFNVNSYNITFYIRRLMLAILKYRDGITKANMVSEKDILTCYANIRGDITPHLNKLFKKAIAVFEGDDESYRDYIIPDLVTFEVIKQKGLLHYTLDTRIDEIKDLLLHNPYNLTNHQLDVIRQAFNIPRSFLMNGKGINKLFKILEPYLLRYEYEKHKIQQDAIEAARKLNESQRVLEEDTTIDIKTQSIEFLTKSNDSVLIVDQNIEYIYAYIINHVKHIDFLSKDELLKLQYMLQEYILLNRTREEAVKILSGNLTKKKLDMNPTLDPYIKAYFEELVRLKNPNVLYQLDLPLDEYIRRHFVLLSQDNYHLKSRIKVSDVHFIDEIQDKYQEINLGRTINYNLDTCTQEDILQYMDYLNDDGTLIADFSFENAKQADNLFNGLRHDTIPVKNRFSHKKNDILIKAKK